MPDNHSKESRSYNMSQIKGKGTKPEEIVCKYLFARGLRYRKNVSSLPGKPDIVFPKHRTVVFINGCFWHKHDCGRFVWPATNSEYWVPKITRNVERDKENEKALTALGWKVLVVWECQLKRKVAGETLSELYQNIVSQI